MTAPASGPNATAPPPIFLNVPVKALIVIVCPSLTYSMLLSPLPASSPTVTFGANVPSGAKNASCDHAASVTLFVAWPGTDDAPKFRKSGAFLSEEPAETLTVPSNVLFPSSHVHSILFTRVR